MGVFMPKKISQKKKEFFQLLIEIYNDERDVVDETYIEKVECLMNRFIEIFIKPKLKNKVELCPIIYTKQRRREEDDYLGQFFKDRGEVEIFSERLLEASDKEERKAMLLRMFSTVAHEIRHYLQWLYNVYFEKFATQTGDNYYDNMEMLEFLGKLLGKNAMEMGDTFAGIGRENKYGNTKIMRKFLMFSKALGIIDMLSFPMELDNSKTQYWLRWIEQDARKIGRKTQIELMGELNGYIKSLHPTAKFPKNFTAVKNIKINNMMAYGKKSVSPKEKKRKGEYEKLSNASQQKERERLKKKLEEHYSILSAIKKSGETTDENVEKATEIFEAICKSALKTIKQEDYYTSLEKHVKSLVSKMSKTTVNDFVDYTTEKLDDTDDASIKEFSQLLNMCIEYNPGTFSNKETLQQILNSFDEFSVFRMIVGMKIEELFPVSFGDEFIEGLSERKVEMDEFVAFVEELDKQTAVSRKGRIFDNALGRLLIFSSSEFYNEEKLRLMEKIFLKKNILWAALATSRAIDRVFPQTEDDQSEM